MHSVAVFASGSGTNAENITRYLRDNDAAGRVALIVCNRPDAYVITRARQLGVPVELITPAMLRDADTFMALMRRYDIDYIVLAGFLLMIPGYLVGAYRGRIVNIHPSLLPRHGGKGMYGHHVHEAVIAAGDTVTGITIHHVSEQCDGGDIIFQTSFDILPGDTAESIEERIHPLEYEHYPRVIAEQLATL